MGGLYGNVVWLVGRTVASLKIDTLCTADVRGSNLMEEQRLPRSTCKYRSVATTVLLPLYIAECLLSKSIKLELRC